MPIGEHAKGTEMRMQSIEGWRGITALLVVLFHIYVAHSLFYEEWLRYLAPVLELFFIISGFVMALGFGDKVTDTKSFVGYLIRRGGRIWPLHLAMLSLLLLIPLLRFVMQTPGDLFSGKLSLEALPYQLLLLQAWNPELALTWNHPSWTLSGEIAAYVLMGLIVWVARSEPLRWVLGLAMIAIAGTIFYQEMQATENYNVLSVSRAVTGFFVGFLLFYVWRRFPLKQARVAMVLEVVTAAGFVAILFWHPTGLSYFWCHAIYALLLYVYASDLGFMSRIMSTPPMMWLGKHSYAMYMFHGVVTTWIMLVVHFIEARIGVPLTDSVVVPGAPRVHAIVLPEQWMNDLLVVAYLGVVLIGGRIIYVVVEQPTRIYFTKLGKQVEANMGAAEKRPAPSLKGEPVSAETVNAPKAVHQRTDHRDPG